MERRYVFALSDLDVVCPAIDAFETELSALTSRLNGIGLTAERSDVAVASVAQSFCYERSKDLMLAQVRLSAQSGSRTHNSPRVTSR
jgi:hypothetical protein